MPTKDVVAAEAASELSSAMGVAAASASCSDSVPAMRDVDDLVNEIKLNLRLRATCPTSSAMGDSSTGEPTLGLVPSSAMRPGNNGAGGSVLVTCSGRTKIRAINHRLTPYFVPPRSGADSGCHSCGSPRCMRTCLRNHGTDSSDPYHLLQELLKNGGLINEAVRRISTTEKPILKCYDYEKDEYDAAATTTTSNLIGLEA